MKRTSMILAAFLLYLLPLFTLAQEWTEHPVIGDFEGARSVYAYDMDGDGDIDVLGAAYLADDITWWENVDGDGLNWTEHEVDGSFESAQSVCAADVDGDGDTDVFGAGNSYGGGIAWWENVDGDGLNWTEHEVDREFHYAESIYVTDMNGDGDIDVFGAASYPTNSIMYWSNSLGDGTTWAGEIVGMVENPLSVYATDVDGDGYKDVLCAAWTADDIKWWKNELFIMWFEYTVDDDFSSPESVYSTDVDGDGDSDILGAAAWDNEITWWENINGDGLTWAEHVMDSDFNVASSVYGADVDGDGDSDILGAAEYDGITWWENPLIASNVDEKNPADLPDEYAVSKVYPNPFNPTTTISVSLPREATLKVTAYNVTGHRVAVLTNGQFGAGNHTMTFDASGMTSGLYFVRVTVPGHLNTVQKVMLVR
jgi:FG-GAP-like repeat/Secretion system C-terminal sorting domain